jgi:hypothetical protein
MSGTMNTDQRQADLAESKATVAAMDDAELFSSAVADEQVESTTIDQPEVQPQSAEPEHKTDATGRLHAPDGKFAPKTTTDAAPTQQQPEQTPSKPDQDAHVPSWRLREEREAREAAERRAQDREAHWQRQIAELQAKLPKAEPLPAPDVFENPDAFLQHGVRQAVDPVKQEIGQLREFYSQRDAVREHGVETVKAAFQALDQAANAGDPEARAVVARVKQSMHPFGDMVAWHKKQTVISQVGDDPNAWFEKQLEDRLNDQAFAGKMLERIRGSANVPVPNGQAPRVRIPPSLNRVAAAARVTGDDDGDLTDNSLYRHATR